MNTQFNNFFQVIDEVIGWVSEIIHCWKIIVSKKTSTNNKNIEQQDR